MGEKVKEGKTIKNVKKPPKMPRPRIPPPGQKVKRVYCSKCAEYVNGECIALENFESRQTYSGDMSKYLRPASVINRNNDCKWFFKNKRKKQYGGVK